MIQKLHNHVLTVFSNNRIVRFVIILYLNMFDYWHES